MQENTRFKKYQKSNLMLLVGTNPLPNFIAGKLLAAEGTKLHLVVSHEMDRTEIPDRLLRLLGKDAYDEQHKLLLKSTDPKDVFTQVYERVKFQGGDWALHYTGGKKSMSTHAYRAMEKALAEKNQVGVYSYLDADTLNLIIDDGIQQIKEYVHFLVCVSVEEVLNLHGREVLRYKTFPFQPDIVKLLVEFCQDQKNRREWLKWAKANLKTEDGKTLNQTIAKQVLIPSEFQFLGGKTLSEIKGKWECSEKECEIAAWLHGRWLEDYVLIAAQEAANSTGVQQVVASLVPRGMVDFEVDVVAMQGYRLFAMTVTTEDEKGLSKLKLFEAIIRARQMGGDEARVAQVTFSENPEVLEKQIAEKLSLLSSKDGKEWSSGIRVFGINDLPNLTTCLETWFKEI